MNFKRELVGFVLGALATACVTGGAFWVGVLIGAH